MERSGASCSFEASPQYESDALRGSCDPSGAADELKRAQEEEAQRDKKQRELAELNRDVRTELLVAEKAGVAQVVDER